MFVIKYKIWREVVYIIYCDTLELLGVHILGIHASNLIAEGALALSMEATAEEIVNTIDAHPTLAETIAEAVEGITGKPIHRERGLKWIQDIYA